MPGNPPASYRALQSLGDVSSELFVPIVETRIASTCGTTSCSGTGNGRLKIVARRSSGTEPCVARLRCRSRVSWPSRWRVRQFGRQCRGGHAEVPFVVLVPDGNSQIHHPGVIRIGSDAELQQFAAC